MEVGAARPEPLIQNFRFEFPLQGAHQFPVTQIWLLGPKIPCEATRPAPQHLALYSSQHLARHIALQRILSQASLGKSRARGPSQIQIWTRWLERMSSLRPGKAHPALGIAPQKPLLILVVCDLAEEGKLGGAPLRKDGALAFRFSSYWRIVAEATELPRRRLSRRTPRSTRILHFTENLSRLHNSSDGIQAPDSKPRHGISSRHA
jgi:hypothetical protein